jgi:thiol-disulfide isomerase/thioredoxin
MRRWIPVAMLRMLMTPFALLGVLLLAACSDSSTAPKSGPAPEPAEVTLTPVKWADLERAIAAHRGRVVVIDLWGESCIPCKKEFPHLVEMQKKYRQDGLVCISVTGDEQEYVPKALAFLKRMNAKFENYQWVDTVDAMEDHLGSTALPAVNVYGRDGRLAKVFKNTTPFDHTDVENLVQSLLK